MATASYDEMQALLAEAEDKERAHYGAWFSLKFDGGQTVRWELWPRRLTLAQRRVIRQVTGLAVETALGHLFSGQLGSDTVVSLIWASVFQQSGQRLDPEQLVHLVDRAVPGGFDAGELRPPDQLEPGDTAGDVDAVNDGGASDPEA